MANWKRTNFPQMPFHGNLLINTLTPDSVLAERTTTSRSTGKQCNWTLKNIKITNNSAENILFRQQTVGKRKIKWSAPGLTFLFQVNLDGDKVFKEHIVDVGVILLKEVLEFSRLRIFYTNKRNVSTCYSKTLSYIALITLKHIIKMHILCWFCNLCV